MEEFVHSVWFALITGAASLVGAILALYQLRIKYRPHSRFRTMEWEKILIISFGVGILIFAGISFYNQYPPPSFFLFRNLYDFMHGTEGSFWIRNQYFFRATFQRSGYIIEITEINLTNSITRVHFHATPQHGAPISTDFDPFQYPLIGTTKGIRYPSISKYITSRNNKIIIGYVDFPSLFDESGAILIWDEQSNLSEASSENVSMRLTADERGHGTSIWALLLIIGVIVITIGVSYSPFDSFKRKLIEEGKELQKEQYRELEKILKGRPYDDLPIEEKQKYDQTCKYYIRIQETIFKTLAGDSGKPSNESD